MSFDLLTNLNTLVGVLQDYNTTTASPYLSQSLSTKILDENIMAGDPEVLFTPNQELPAIYVRVLSKEASHVAIGPSGPSGHRKECDIVFEIVGLYGREAGYQSPQDTTNEVYKMAQNIEGVLEAEYRLSNTAMWTNPGTATFQGPFDVSGGHMKTVAIELTTKYQYR